MKLEEIFAWAVWIGGFGIAGLVAVYSMWNAAEKSKSKRVQKETYAAVLKPIVSYADRYDSGLQKFAKRLRASGEDGEDMSTDRILLADIIALIRSIVLPQDQIRLSDAELLQCFCWSRRMYEFDHFSTHEFVSMIETIRPKEGLMGFSVLSTSFLQGTTDAKEFARIFLDLGTAISVTPEYASEDRLASFAVLRDGLEDFMSRASTEADTETLSGMEGDERYSVLKAVPGCTQEELKAAYRQEAALWHPDKVAHLAPELQAHAEMQMTRINEAYQALSTE